MTALDDLLAIQDLDTMLDQLRHRRATLPELATLAQLAQDAADARSAVRDEVAGRLHAVRSAQKEAEDHASLLEDKAREVNTSMYDGSVSCATRSSKRSRRSTRRSSTARVSSRTERSS